MNDIPPSNDESEDVDDLYRRASALDPSRPSEPVRRAVLEHAARLAAERTANAERTATKAPRGIGSTRVSGRQTWWRPAAFGTLAAAVLAGVLIAPQFLTPRAPPRTASAPAQVSQPKAAATPEAPTERKERQRESAAPGEIKEQLSGSVAQAEIKEQPRGSAADEGPPSPASASPPALAPAPAPSPASPEVKGNAAATSDAAAEIAANNAPAKVESMAKARSGAAASSDSQADARRTQTTTSPVSGMLAAPRAAAPVPQELAAALRRAAEIGDVSTLQTLLGKQPVIDARDEDGRTALMLATLHGQAAAVDALLAHGADPNAADARGMTPIQAAVAGNQRAIVAALQRAGAR